MKLSQRNPELSMRPMHEHSHKTLTGAVPFSCPQQDIYLVPREKLRVILESLLCESCYVLVIIKHI